MWLSEWDEERTEANDFAKIRTQLLPVMLLDVTVIVSDLCPVSTFHL